jgi:hypothetical protein
MKMTGADRTWWGSKALFPGRDAVSHHAGGWAVFEQVLLQHGLTKAGCLERFPMLLAGRPAHGVGGVLIRQNQSNHGINSWIPLSQ